MPNRGKSVCQLEKSLETGNKTALWGSLIAPQRGLPASGMTENWIPACAGKTNRRGGSCARPKRVGTRPTPTKLGINSDRPSQE